MISVPSFSGSYDFQSYSEIETRIKKFDKHSVIGIDGSGTHDMHLIELGEEGKPPLLLTASLHGSEWQSTQYNLTFMEQLRDDAYPDKKMRDDLMANYHVLCIPVCNPWGLTKTSPYAITDGRFTSSGADLNADFHPFNEPESQVIKKIMDKYPIFAYLDSHLIRGHVRDVYLIVGNGQSATDDIKENWASSLENFSNQPVDRWSAYDNSLAMGLTRRYMRDKPNPYTPYTLSYITEIARPVNETAGFHAPLTDEEIYQFGMANVYLFMKTSLEYFEQHNHGDILRIETPTTVYEIARDYEGNFSEATETTDNQTIKSTVTRGEKGEVVSVIRELV